MANLSGLFIFALVIAGGDLLLHLGAGSVPNALKPLAKMWAESGRSPKSFNLVLWGLFVVIAVAVFGYIAFFLYTPLLDLGRK